jgi:hypothetical protein
MGLFIYNALSNNQFLKKNGKCTINVRFESAN